MTTLLVTHSACLDHLTPAGHPERPDRLRAIDQALEAETFQALAREKAPLAELDTIALCHPMDYIEAIKDADVVIGSRYKQGVNVINWPMSRLLLSLGANQYARVVTGMPVEDSTGGFKCFRRKVLESLELDRVKSNGYAFQIEMSFRAWKKGFRIVEIPIVFTDRVEGQSKMSRKIVREAIWMVWWLRLRSMVNKL